MRTRVEGRASRGPISSTQDTGINLTFPSFVAAATARALRENRSLNARVLTDSYVLLGEISLGIAVDTPEGLVAPRLVNSSTVARIMRAKATCVKGLHLGDKSRGQHSQNGQHTDRFTRHLHSTCAVEPVLSLHAPLGCNHPARRRSWSTPAWSCTVPCTPARLSARHQQPTDGSVEASTAHARMSTPEKTELSASLIDLWPSRVSCSV